MLDLTDEHDLGRARELAGSADVIVENFRPDVMDKLGLGYETVGADNPGLIFCSITGFGGGAGAELPGYDLLVQALGGLMSITGSPEGEPQKVGVALVDVLAGLFASVGILAALRHRDRTGEGQRVEINLLSSLLAGLVNQASAYTIAGVVPGRMGNAHPSISPYELYETGAGELVVAVGNERQFAALCDVLGAPELAADPRFATNSDRVTTPRGAQTGARDAAGGGARRAVGAAADGGARPRRRGQRSRRRVRAGAGGGPGSDRAGAGGGRVAGGAHAQPDRAVANAADVPQRAAGATRPLTVRPRPRPAPPSGPRSARRRASAPLRTARWCRPDSGRPR